MIQEATSDLPNVEIDSFFGLTAQYAQERGANLLIRGLRAVSDFDAEFQMALTNKKLNPELETIFLMTSPKYLFLSSSTVKEIALMGGCTQGMSRTLLETGCVKSVWRLPRGRNDLSTKSTTSWIKLKTLSSTAPRSR
jgi:pantetheine-phosphate adenylyltransferase